MPDLAKGKEYERWSIIRIDVGLPIVILFDLLFETLDIALFDLAHFEATLATTTTLAGCLSAPLVTEQLDAHVLAVDRREDTVVVHTSLVEDAEHAVKRESTRAAQDRRE